MTRLLPRPDPEDSSKFRHAIVAAGNGAACGPNLCHVEKIDERAFRCAEQRCDKRKWQYRKRELLIKRIVVDLGAGRRAGQ